MDLSAFAGKTLSNSWLTNDTDSGVGDWDIYYADIAIYSSDGTVTPIYHQQTSSGLTFWQAQSGVTNYTANVDQVVIPGDNNGYLLSDYFVGDHLGTTQMEFSSGGWPVWKGEFSPFGQELDTQATSNHYKFTGKERDQENGLDFFGARYYASSMGRWMSPDWSDKPEAVPYSSLDNPQSLNLYGYVGNNPLSNRDSNGHFGELEEAELAYEQQIIDSNRRGQQKRAQQQNVGSVARGTYESNTSAYLEANSSGAYPAGSPKCNKFVADQIEDSGRPRPQVPRGIWGIFGFKRDPTAKEWADPSVNIPGWSGTMPLLAAQSGDVIAQQHGQNGGHSGILALSDTGGLLTVSVSSVTNPAGTVVMNNWGFRPGGGEGPGDPAPVVRRYVGTLP